MPDNEFRQKLITEIREKEKAKKKLEQQRFEIQSQLRALDDDLKALETSLSVHDNLMGISSPKPSQANSNSKRFKYATTADACVELMKELGGHAKTRTLMERLVKAGKLTSNYASAYTTVLKALQRDNRFEQIGRGEFALKEAMS